MEHMSFRKKWFKNMKIYIENIYTVRIHVKDKENIIIDNY